MRKDKMRNGKISNLWREIGKASHSNYHNLKCHYHKLKCNGNDNGDVRYQKVYSRR